MIRTGAEVAIDPTLSSGVVPVDAGAVLNEVPQVVAGVTAPVQLPYAFARKFGVALDGDQVALREGSDPRALIEVRRVLRRAFDVAVIEPAAFDRLLSDNYAMDGQATAAAAVGMGDELDLLAEGLPTADDLLDTSGDPLAIGKDIGKDSAKATLLQQEGTAGTQVRLNQHLDAAHATLESVFGRDCRMSSALDGVFQGQAALIVRTARTQGVSLS